MKLASQPDAKPTNKLTAGLVIATAVQLALIWFPDMGPKVLQSIEVLQPLVALALGGSVAWLVPDRPNIPWSDK